MCPLELVVPPRFLSDLLMARSPVNGSVASAPGTFSRTQRTRQPRSKARHRFGQMFETYHRMFPSFRIGYRYARRHPPPTPKPQIRYIKEIQPEDPRLRNQLEQFKKQNVAMAKDNSRLKTEKYHLTSAIHKLHHQELEFYETKQELMNLKESFVGLVAAIRKMRNLQLADDVIESLNAAEATAMTKNNSPHVLGSFASHLQIHDRGPVHSPMLTPVQEEPVRRADTAYVKAVSQVALSAKRASKKRNTALPGELLESIVNANLRSPSKSVPFYSDAVTPTSADGTPEFRLTPLPPFNEVRAPAPHLFGPVSPAVIGSAPVAVAKRSIAAALDPPNPRLSLGASPRGAGHARRSVRYSPSVPPPDDNTQNGSKKPCFAHEDEEEEDESVWDGVHGDLSKVLESVEDLVVPVECLSLVDEENKSEENEEPSSRRSLGRKAKANIKSLKEPKLNTKMRRPADVPPLTPRHDKRRLKRSNSKSLDSGHEGSVSAED